MLNTGYFTSRNQIIDWINQLLSIQLTKIEQLGSGNIYCHILDAAYPGKVPLSKVKWGAYLQVDFLYNFKILQTSFQKLGINKAIDSQKLSKAKYQDNLEFIQWMKWFLAPSIKDNTSYNALARRNHSEVHLLFTDRPKVKQQKAQNKIQNKENMYASVLNKNKPSLKSYKSVEQIKMLPCDENSLRRAFEKGQSLRALLEPTMTSSYCDMKKTKKQKIEVTLKPSLGLQERQREDNNKLISQEEQCF